MIFDLSIWRPKGKAVDFVGRDHRQLLWNCAHCWMRVPHYALSTRCLTLIKIKCSKDLQAFIIDKYGIAAKNREHGTYMALSLHCDLRVVVWLSWNTLSAAIHHCYPLAQQWDHAMRDSSAWTCFNLSYVRKSRYDQLLYDCKPHGIVSKLKDVQGQKHRQWLTFGWQWPTWATLFAQSRYSFPALS